MDPEKPHPSEAVPETIPEEEGSQNDDTGAQKPLRMPAERNDGVPEYIEPLKKPPSAD